MLLRSSITTTKKFFQRTLKNFKSLFSSEDNYQKLPKASPHNHLSYSLASMDNEKSENEEAMRKKRIKNKATILSSPKKQENEVVYNGRSYNKLSNANSSKEKREKGKEKDSLFISMKERKYCMEEKLRELEMMDISNVDYVLEIEEVLYYYSRLTCPAYVEIVDKFFLEMYSELFGSTWLATPSSVNSRLNLRYH